ncbi:hypothetical protein Rctr197k_116 [Virus Rctr197k]|nr:hypothetical protein Rctr197k_116 [Virus Rctr197k]
MYNEAKNALRAFDALRTGFGPIPELERAMDALRSALEGPVPGKEAEELRSGIEKLLHDSNFEDGEAFTDTFIDALRELLEDIDARDSVDYLESKAETKAKPERVGGPLIGAVMYLLSHQAGNEKGNGPGPDTAWEFIYYAQQKLLDYEDLLDQPLREHLKGHR